ncbi:SAM-dependent methyltransferase [Streptomyces sp. NPDC014986]|uniref:SAM-dependent methyltransferase n=1 Tax=Streptomyces sp. NPDC014986 TaxID=3364934 RepID=UPI0036FE90DF
MRASVGARPDDRRAPPDNSRDEVRHAGRRTPGRPRTDTGRAHPVRVHAWPPGGGGSHPADEAVGERPPPGARAADRRNHRFARRAAGRLAGQGAGRFPGVATGIPTEPEPEPESRAASDPRSGPAERGTAGRARAGVRPALRTRAEAARSVGGPHLVGPGPPAGPRRCGTDPAPRSPRAAASTPVRPGSPGRPAGLVRGRTQGVARAV